MRVAMLTCALGTALALAQQGSAQQLPMRTAIVPDSITVGDVMQAAVRVHVPHGATVEFPDSLVLPPELENAGERTLQVDTTTEGIEIIALYPLAGWRPGAHAMPAIPFTVA